MTAVKRIRDAENCRQLEDHHAFLTREIGKVRVIRIRIVAPMITREQRHDHTVARAQSEDLGVENEIKAVLVMFPLADEKADLMQDGSDAQDEFVFGLQPVEFLQFLKNLLGEHRHMLGVRSIRGVFFSNDPCGLQHFVLEGLGLRIVRKQVHQQVALEVAFRNHDELVVKASRQCEVGLQRGNHAFNARVVEVQLAHHFIRTHAGKLLGVSLHLF